MKGINTDHLVSSFKLKKLSPFVLRELESIEEIAKEEEKQNKKDKKSRTTSSFAQSKAFMEVAKQKESPVVSVIEASERIEVCMGKANASTLQRSSSFAAAEALVLEDSNRLRQHVRRYGEMPCC